MCVVCCKLVYNICTLHLLCSCAVYVLYNSCIYCKMVYALTGLQAVGANIQGCRATLSSEVAVDLPVSLLTWTR